MSKKNIFKLIALSYFLICLIEYPVRLFNFKYLLILGLVLLNAVFVRGFLYAYKAKKLDYLIPRLVFLLNYLNASYLLFYLFPNINFGIKSVIIAVFTIFLYVLMLSINVYLVSDLYKEVIPLLQPSRLIVYIGNILNVFLSLSFIYKLPIFYNLSLYNFIAKIILIIGYIVLYFYYLDWYIKSEAGQVTRHEIDDIRELKLFAITSMAILAIVLMFVPFESFGRALIIGGYMYCVMGYIQGFISRRIHTGFIVSTVLVMAGTYFLVSFL